MAKPISLIAAEEVYTSAEKIIAENNRSLYPKMLQLLTKVTKAEKPSITNFINENRLRIWFKDLMPLLFDKNPNIQDNAIIAFEALIPFLNVSNYQNHPDWPAIKMLIINSYSPVMGDLLQNENSNWYKLWQICIRLLNKAITKSVVINSFLSTVERGFRSNVSQIRAEAFLCWKTLVEIYSKQSDTFTPKQIKLLCTPLKPTPSKTLDIALNKYRVWWYFLCKLNGLPGTYSKTILAPFLDFSFGTLGVAPFSDLHPEKVPCKIYPQLIPMVTSSLISLLGKPNVETIKLHRENIIETMELPLVTSTVFEEMGNHFINYATGITLLIITLDGFDYNEIIECLWKHLTHHISCVQTWDCFDHVLKNTNLLINECEKNELHSGIVSQIISIVGHSNIISAKLTEKELSPDTYFKAVKQLTLLLSSKSLSINYIQEKKIIENIYAFDTIKINKNYSIFLMKLLNYITSSSENCALSMGIRDRIWFRLVDIIDEHLSEHEIESDDDKTTLYNYLLWPLGHVSEIPISTFKLKWYKIAKMIYSTDKLEFGLKCSTIIAEVAKRKQYPYINEIVAMIFEFLDVDFARPEDAPFDEFECVMKIICLTPIAFKDLNPIVEAINCYIKKLNGNQLLILYPTISGIVLYAEKAAKNLRVDQVLINEFRRLVKETLSSKEMQVEIKQIKDEKIKKELLNLTQASDKFVAIPKTWQFNPDKLTEHQKEKLKERKRDIPALYNDMSQSQDSVSIQAWSPKITAPINGKSEQMETNTVHIEHDIDHSRIENLPNESSKQVEEITTSLRKQSKLNAELKKIQINTVEGKELLKEKPRLRQRSERTYRDFIRKKATTTSKLIESPKSPSKKTPNKLDNSFEVVEASQKNAPRRLSRRSLKFEKNTTKLNISNLVNQTETTNSFLEVQPNNTDCKENPAVFELHGEQPKNNNEMENLENVQADDTLPMETELMDVEVVDNTKDSDPIAIDTMPMDSELLDVYTEENITNRNSFQENDCSKENNLDVSHNKQIALDASIITDEELGVTIAEVNRQINNETENHEIEKDPNDEEIENLETDTNKTSLILETSIEIDDVPNNKSILDQTIFSSPNLADLEKRNTDLLSSTIDISPILEKNSPPKITEEPSKSDECVMSLAKECASPKIYCESPRTHKIPSSTPILPGLINSPHIVRNMLYGRGAKLLNLVNFKDTNSPKQKISTEIMEPVDESFVAKDRKSSLPEVVDEKIARHHNKDLLTFSKPIPSPHASPAAAILKRKLADISVEECKTPGKKRKCVSFRDPPVSETKEFIAHSDEYSSRSLNIQMCKATEFDEMAPQIAKIFLKRKSRADSMVEIAQLAKLAKTSKISAEPDMKAIMVNGTVPVDFNGIQENGIHLNGLDVDVFEDDISVTPSPMLTFSSKEAALKFVMEEYSLKECLGTYMDNDPNSTTNFTKEVSNLLNDNEKIRSALLGELSEKYSKEFLEHAIQENLSSAICDRLSIDTILESIKGKTISSANDDVQLKIRQHLGDILKNIFTQDLNDQIVGNSSTDKDTKAATVCASVSLDQALKIISKEAETNSSSKQMIIDNFCSIFENVDTSDNNQFNEVFHRNLLRIFSRQMSYEQVFDYLNVICRNKSKAN